MEEILSKKPRSTNKRLMWAKFIFGYLGISKVVSLARVPVAAHFRRR
jgi:hypothetical protein